MEYVKAPAEFLRPAEGGAASYNINTYAISEDFHCLSYSNAANVILASAFGVSFLLHVWQGIRSKCWTFLSVMAVGGFLETVGYLSLVLLRDDPLCRIYMSAQLTVLSVAPTYLAFGIYIILNHILLTFTSGAKPQTHICAFTINTIISAILQASSTLAASTSNRVIMPDSVKLAVFISQIYMLSILARILKDFAAILCDLESLESFNSCAEVRKLFIPVTIASAAFCIRSLYRTADLVFGYSLPLVQIEGLFVNLEGCMCLTIMLAFNFFHPGSTLSLESGEYLELPSVDKQEAVLA